MKVKILTCTVCACEVETVARLHTNRCCGHRMHITDWRLKE